MGTFSARLKQAMQKKNCIAADLARWSGLSTASISDWLNDKADPEKIKSGPLLTVAAKLEVNPMWLVIGKGMAAPNSPTVLVLNEPAPTYKSSWPFSRVTPERWAELEPATKLQVESFVEGVLLGSAGQRHDKSNGTEG